MRLGIRNVSLDDITEELGISKKTIYAHYVNKADLVQHVIKQHIEKEKLFCEGIFSGRLNSIEELMAIGYFLCSKFDRMKPGSIVELKRFFPESWKLYESHRMDYVKQILIGNINRGKTQGLYREDLSEKLIVELYMNNIDHLLRRIEESSMNSSMSKEYLEYLKYHIFGISTPLGSSFLTEYLKKIPNNEYDYFNL